MDTAEFLSAVLPTDDNYILWIKPNDTKTGYNAAFTDLAKCANAALTIDAQTSEVYFAVGKHNRGNYRKQESATWFKALAFDIDVGENKPYQSQRDAAGALLSAQVAIGLPDPMINSSGNGLHGYFPMTMAIKRDDWVRLSRMLHAAFAEHGLKVDTSKISEPSMVLRPIGTHNKKNPDNWKLVRCLQTGAVSDPRTLVKILMPWASRTAVSPAAPNKVSAVAQAILGTDVNPVPLDSMRACLQVNSLLETGGETALEPLWRASLGVAKYCTDVEQAIVLLAGKHPEFDLDKNRQKLANWSKGPPTCAHFESVNPQGCEGCSFKGKVTAPISLATVDTQNLTDPRLAEIRFPKGYSYNGKWILYKGPLDEEASIVSSILIYPVAQFTDVDHAQTIIRLAIRYPVEGWKEVDMPHSALTADGKEFNDFIYSKRLWMTGGQSKALRSYLVSYLRELTEAIKTNYMYEHYGWQLDGNFLAGNVLIDGKTGAEHATDIQFSKLAIRVGGAIEVAGVLDKWAAATAMFDLPQLKYHGFAFLIGLSGPLLIGSGIPGFLVNMYSPDSGSGKSITGMFALSAWGDPERMFMTVRDTQNALYKKFGTLHSTAAYIDEITMIELEPLRKLVLAVTQGREGDRGTQGMKDLANASSWCMPILASSNQDLHNLLELRIRSEAEKYRTLQLPFNRVDVFETGGANLGYNTIRLLKANHGHAGIRLVKAIVRKGGRAWIERKYHDTLISFPNKYGIAFTGPERYIQAAFVLADITGELAEEEGLIEFDYKAKIRTAADYFLEHREHEQSVVLRGPDIVNQFLLEHADSIIQYTDDRDTNKQYVRQPAPTTGVARMEIAVKNSKFIGGNLYINRSEIKRWCRLNGQDYGHLLDQLRNSNVIFDDSKRYTLYKGVPGMGGVGQTRCLYIDLSSHVTFIENGQSALGAMTPTHIDTRLKEAV